MRGYLVLLASPRNKGCRRRAEKITVRTLFLCVKFRGALKHPRHVTKDFRDDCESVKNVDVLETIGAVLFLFVGNLSFCVIDLVVILGSFWFVSYIFWDWRFDCYCVCDDIS